MLKKSHGFPVLSLSNLVDKFSLYSHTFLAQRTLNILSSEVIPTTAAKITVVSNIVCPHFLLHFGMSGLALNYRCDATSMNTVEIILVS